MLSPRSQLLLYVVIAATAVGGAWLLLFARNALTPKTAATTGPSFQEISQGLDRQLEAYDKRFEELQNGERKNGEPGGTMQNPSTPLMAGGEPKNGEPE